MKANYLGKKKLLITILAIITLIAVILSLFLFNRYREMEQKIKDPTHAAELEVDQWVTKISKIINLPAGERPTLATVNDKERLVNQPFFAEAEVGDKVLIYEQARRAYLYRPGSNKIINVSQININQLAPSPTASLEASPSALPIPLEETISPLKEDSQNVNSQ